jgi:GntR family transcriptional regulator, transcriptional repressor for pyruvate dehydrogenase complex
MRQVRDSAETALLLAMLDSGRPLGARQGRVSLKAAGFTISEATVSRMLREFDERSWTVPVDTKGRVLTSEGKHQAMLARVGNATSSQMLQAVDVRSARDLVDLLYARRTVERETAREAALTATAEDIERLRYLVRRHEDCAAHNAESRTLSLEFHRGVASLATNRIVRAMSDLVLAGHLEKTEAVLDIIVASAGGEPATLADHWALVEAIASGNSATAEQLMNDHLSRLIEEAEPYLAGDRPDMIGRLVSWLEAEDQVTSRAFPRRDA